MSYSDGAVSYVALAPSREPELTEAIHVAQCELTMLRDERDLLRVQLQAFQGMPFVPKADFERLQAKYGEALQQLDAIAKDSPEAAQLDRMAVCLAQMIRQRERIGGYADDRDQMELREARACLAESR